MTATLGTAAMWGAVVALVAAGALALRGPTVAATAAAAAVVHRLGVALVTVAIGCLAWALTTGDFTLAYVAATTDRATSWPYRLAGLWGGMGGSLLLWSALVAMWGWRRSVGGAERAALAWLAASFLVVDAVWATPWHRLAAPAIDGIGATPILRHPAMLYHPPILYLGLTALAVPWATTVAAGVARRWDPTTAARVRRQLLAALGVLTLGMVAGAHWAYVELGWGGYWAWDPVENTALLPWLAVIGALHGLTAGRRHATGAADGPGPLVEPVDLRPRRVGLAAPVLTSAALAVAVLGTMLTRSGAAPSVHAFGEDGAVGWALVAVTAAVVVVSAAAVARLRVPVPVPGPVPAPPPRPQPEPAVESAVQSGRFDRRFGGWALRAQPWLAGFALVVVLLGTVRPLVGSEDVAVDGTYYASILAPVGLVAVALAMRFRPGHLAHIGVLLLAIGIVGSTRSESATATLEPGQSIEVRGWEVVNEGVAVVGDDTVRATVDLRRDGDHVATLRPEVVAFPERGVELAETSLRSTPLNDVQVVLRHADDDGRALLEVHVRPLVWFVWWGGLVLAASALWSAVRARPRVGPPTGVRLPETSVGQAHAS